MRASELFCRQMSDDHNEERVISHISERDRSWLRRVSLAAAAALTGLFGCQNHEGKKQKKNNPLWNI